MKSIIKTVLREETDDTMMGSGTWADPHYDSEPSNDMVPPTSYTSRTLNRTDKKYSTTTITKNIFFKGVKLLVNAHDKDWFSSRTQLGDNLWERQSEALNVLKLIGLDAKSTDYGTLIDKIFWAAHDNFDGLKNNTITGYDQLKLRALKRYTLSMEENVQVYKSIEWEVTVVAYDEDDAEDTVVYDEDGTYDSWEWSHDKGYQEDIIEWEGQGREQQDIKGYEIIYPDSGYGSGKGPEGFKKEEAPITETVGPSPEENDVLDDLDGLIIKWGNSRYSKELKKVINKYKNLSL